MVANAYAQYQTNAIMAAKPAELTLMLYDGAIKFGNQTIDALEKGEYEKAHNLNLRVQDIITELLVTLDNGNEQMHIFRNVYTFANESLIRGNISRDAQKIRDAVEVIREVRNLWKDIMKAAQ